MVIVLNKADAGNNNRDKVLAWMNDKSLLLVNFEIDIFKVNFGCFDENDIWITTERTRIKENSAFWY